MDLFEDNRNSAKPLAERMRCTGIEEFIGQKHLVGEGCLLRRAIKADRVGSCIFYGPPGTGKTTTIMACAKMLYGSSHSNMILEAMHRKLE